MNKYSVCVHTMFFSYRDTSNIDVVDHFSLNQCRSEEITLKEDFGSGFLNLADFGNKQFLSHVMVLPNFKWIIAICLVYQTFVLEEKTKTNNELILLTSIFCVVKAW